MTEPQHDHGSNCTHAADSSAGTAIDPVCGMSVDPAKTAHVATHAGAHHYFCNAGCLAKFNADPERYLGDAPPAAEPAMEGAI